MSIVYEKDIARLGGTVNVEDAECFLEWVQTHPQGEIDLSACEHLHAANLQVLMASRLRIASWPAADDLARWMKNTFYLPQGD
jgi:hypothetical protein